VFVILGNRSLITQSSRGC